MGLRIFCRSKHRPANGRARGPAATIEQLEKQINEYPWGRRLLSETKDKDALGDPKNIFSRATGALSITLGLSRVW
jgi:hypothetical protein